MQCIRSELLRGVDGWVAPAWLPESWSPDSKYLFVSNTGVLSMPEGKVALKSQSRRGAFSPTGDRLYVWGEGDHDLLAVPNWEPAGSIGGSYPWASWSPDGRYIALSAGDLMWAVYSKNGKPAWQEQFSMVTATGRPFWSPDGRFVVIPGVGIGDTSDGQFHQLQEDLGVPVGWNRSGALFFGPGHTVVDDEYVKPTQFGR